MKNKIFNNKNFLLHLLSVTIVFTALNTGSNMHATSKYICYLNDFKGYKDVHNTVIDKRLIEENKSCSPIIRTCQCAEINTDNFCIFARMANLNNAEGKSYKVTNTTNGKQSKVSNPCIGFVWNYTDSLNYYSVTLKCTNSNLHDITDKRTLNVTISQTSNGIPATIKEVALSKDIDLFYGLNTIRINFDGDSTYIAVGAKKLKHIASLSVIPYSKDSQIGYLVGAGAKLSLERISYTSEPSKSEKLQTSWTTAEVNSIISKSQEPIVGYWTYLDRDLDENKIKLGGKYKVAIVPNKENPDRYDILYYDGAKVNRTKWEPLMLKGSLTRTRFLTTYDLEWYDATMDVFNNDTYASIDGIILTLNFPIHKSQIRLSKVKNK